MDVQINALIKNGTWSLAKYEHGMNVVGSKWVFRIKRNPDGSVERYKARLVATGFHQQEGIDYGETFSPVIKPCTIRLVLSIAVMNHWPLRQLDVENAFLHGELDEEVYMKQPPGYVDPNYPNHVCRLHKSLYGLKQAPRAWFSKLSGYLKQLGFTASIADNSLFVRQTSSSIIYVLVYVDDIIVTGSSSSLTDKLITDLGSAFAVKDMGALTYFLGVEVIKQGAHLILTQHKYIADLLRRTNLEGIKPVCTLLAAQSKLQKQGSEIF